MSTKTVANSKVLKAGLFIFNRGKIEKSQPRFIVKPKNVGLKIGIYNNPTELLEHAAGDLYKRLLLT